MKLQPASKKELKHIAIGVSCFTAIEVVVFAVLHRFTWQVLLGALLGGGYAVLNFLFLALSAQQAVAAQDMAREIMQRSYHLRMLGIFLMLVLAYALPCFHLLSAAIPLLFPRLTILVMQITGQVNLSDPASGKEESSNNGC